MVVRGAGAGLGANTVGNDEAGLVTTYGPSDPNRHEVKRSCDFQTRDFYLIIPSQKNGYG